MGSAPPSTASPTTEANSVPRAALKLTSVLYEKKGSIAYVTVNRPKVLNALDTPTWTDLRAAFEQAKADRSVHGVILTGAGDKAFMAGADISELAHVDAYDAEESSRFGQGVPDLIENLGKPVIAAVNGFCARRRLRDGDGLYNKDRGGARQIRAARGLAGPVAWRWRNAAFAAPGREGTRVATDPHGRDDCRAASLSHRPRQ
jgi:hypothetical protein